MSGKIEIKKQKFYLNGKEVFLSGAELHYFRVPKKLWMDRLLKIKEAGCNVVSTYIPWSFHEKVESEIDLTGKTLPEKDLKSFLDLTLELDLYVLVRPGPYVMAEIRNHGLPLWLFSNYPEVIAKRIDGSDHTIVSYLNKTYLSLVDKWYQAVFEIVSPRQITNGGNIILCQLDNEVGMFPWIMNHPDYSDFTITRFCEYLTKKYSLLQFKELFNYDGNSIEEYVFQRIKNPQEENAIILMNEFMLFYREYYRDYIKALKQIAEKHGLNVPVIVNVHGFHSIDYAKRGLQYPIGLSQLLLTSEIDNVVIAGDYYIGNLVPDNYFDIILANAFTSAVQPNYQPLFSAEFQSGFQNDVPRIQPTTTDLKVRICVANGMNAINYYMFVGGENYEGIGIMGRHHDWQAPIGRDGSLRVQYYVIEHLNKVIKTYGKELLDAKYESVIHLAFDPDYFMTEYDNVYTRPFKNELQRMREQILFNGIGKALSYMNISFAGLNIKDKIDVEKVPALWVFSTGYMNENIQQKLVNYVKNGGQLIISPLLPTKDLNQNDCTIFIDELNIDIIDRKDWQMIKVGDIDNISSPYTQAYNVKDGFAYRENSNEVIGFVKEFGQGKVVVFGAGMISEHYYKIDAYHHVAKQIGIDSIVKCDDWLNVFVRKGERGTFIFINNLDEYDKESTFIYKNQLLFEGRKLTIPMRKGFILPIDWFINDDVLVKYSTCEFISLKEDDKQIELVATTNQVAHILIETNLQLEISNGQLNKENNKYKIITNRDTVIRVKK